LKFGQPLGAAFQIAYTVQDMEKSVADFTQRLGIGPWYPFDYRATAKARYRGAATSLHARIIRGFCGHLNVELIQQLDDGPSVYRDVIERRGHGFHHWSVGTAEFDRDVASYEEAGYELAYFEDIPGRHRLAYMDTTADMPGMVELCEMTEVHEAFLHRMYQTSVGFDGTDPIRDQVP
jgi:4-hydroxyphenylpyruvate dioxygenase-like putative hemolysin